MNYVQANICSQCNLLCKVMVNNLGERVDRLELWSACSKIRCGKRMRSNICITLAKELQIIEKMKTLVVQCYQKALLWADLGPAQGFQAVFLTYGHEWAADEVGWVPPAEAPRRNMKGTAPTAAPINTCMDEKEIHSKSTLKKRHLIPEALTDLIVPRCRGETGIQASSTRGCLW